MLYSESFKKYLHGENFSNGAGFRLNEKNKKIAYRDEYLSSLAKNKKILHIGFVDHLPLIDEKITQGNWLHKKLMDVSDICVGIDINKEGIEYLEKKYKYKNLYIMDILSDTLPKEIEKIDFDYIFIPDVIEHIGNPVSFLQALREKFINRVDKMIVTTPNAFRLNNLINTLKDVEVINTDHRFWFTPYTLSKVFSDAGFKVNNLEFLEHGILPRRKIFKKYLLSKFNALKDTLVIEVNLK